jgi:predicted GNAT family acetyltransferase
MRGLSLLHVDTDLRRTGRGPGLMPVRTAPDAAPTEWLEVLPVCPLVRNFIERHPVYMDMVPAGQGERFSLGA